MKLAPAVFLLCFSVAPLCAQNDFDQLMADGHYKRARVAIEARYKDAPNDPETLRRLSRVRQLWGNLDEAYKLAERAVALAPKDAEAHYQLAETAGQKAEKASMIHQMGLGRQFKKEIDLVLQLDAKHTGAMRGLMVFYLEAPGVIGGDKAKARMMAEQIARLDPVEGAQAQIDLARRLKQEIRPEELLRKATSARPESYEGHLQLGTYLANQKNLADGEREAREAIRLHPGRVTAYGLLAAIQVHQEHWNDLGTTLTQAEKAVPDNLLPYFRAANNCLTRKVELGRAEGYFRKYLTMEPEPGSPGVAAVRWRLGLVLEAMGRKADAIKEIEASVAMDGNNPQVKADLKRLR